MLEIDDVRYLAQVTREAFNPLRVEYRLDADFAGMCGYVAHGLVSVLRSVGERSTLVVGEVGNTTEGIAYHCWIHYRGFVVDPTYTQFFHLDLTARDSDVYTGRIGRTLHRSLYHGSAAYAVLRSADWDPYDLHAADVRRHARLAIARVRREGRIHGNKKEELCGVRGSRTGDGGVPLLQPRTRLPVGHNVAGGIRGSEGRESPAECIGADA